MNSCQLRLSSSIVSPVLGPHNEHPTCKCLIMFLSSCPRRIPPWSSLFHAWPRPSCTHAGHGRHAHLWPGWRVWGLWCWWSEHQPRALCSSPLKWVFAKLGPYNRTHTHTHTHTHTCNLFFSCTSRMLLCCFPYIPTNPLSLLNQPHGVSDPAFVHLMRTNVYFCVHTCAHARAHTGPGNKELAKQLIQEVHAQAEPQEGSGGIKIVGVSAA